MVEDEMLPTHTKHRNNRGLFFEQVIVLCFWMGYYNFYKEDIRMAFSFEIKKPDNLQEVLFQVERDINSEGGTLKGDLNSGKISIKGVEGSYKVEGDVIKITITKKPFIYPESTVKSEIVKYFEKYTKK